MNTIGQPERIRQNFRHGTMQRLLNGRIFLV